MRRTFIVNGSFITRMAVEVLGLEIDHPDEIQEELAHEGFSNQLTFSVRIAKGREGPLFIFSPTIERWASAHLQGKDPSEDPIEVFRFNAFMVKGVLQLGHLMIFPPGYSLFRHAKDGRVGSMVELEAMRWLKQSFPGVMVQELKPTNRRIPILKRRGLKLEKPIPIERLVDVIQADISSHGEWIARRDARKQRIRRFLDRFNVYKKIKERLRTRFRKR